MSILTERDHHIVLQRLPVIIVELTWGIFVVFHMAVVRLCNIYMCLVSKNWAERLVEDGLIVVRIDISRNLAGTVATEAFLKSITGATTVATY